VKLAAIISIFFLGFLADSLSWADESLLVRSQWRTNNINEPNISYFSRDSNGKLYLSGGINLTDETIIRNSDTGSCVNFLSKLVQYPLQKMFDQNFLSREQYDFYRKFGKNLDPPQVVYFNTAIPKVQKIEIKHISLDPEDPFGIQKQVNRTLMENINAFSNPSLSNEELLKESSKMLETQSSLWLVRDHVLDANGVPVRKLLPWQFEKDFSEIQRGSSEGLNFELGRASTENHDDLQTVLKAAILTAANDVLSLNKKLSKSEVIVQAESGAHTRLYQKYGFQLIKNTSTGESLMGANLEDLYKKLNPLQDFHESAPFLDFFENDPIKTLEFRMKLRSAYTEFLEQPTSNNEKPLLIAYHSDWHAFMMDYFSKMTDEQTRKFIYNPGTTPDIFAKNKIPEFFTNSTSAGNHVYGLDASAQSSNPHYLGQTIAGIYLHYINKANQTAAPQVFGKKLIHENPIVFFTEDKIFVDEAKRLGGTVKEVSSSKRSRAFSKNEISVLTDHGYEMTFSIPVVKLIGSHYFSFNKIPELKPGISQLKYLGLNGL